MQTFVLDTSVVIKWFNRQNELDTDKAQDIYNRLITQDITIVVPNLLIVEVQNVLLLSKKLAIENINFVIKRLFSLPLILKEPTIEVIEKTTQIALQNSITAYDALFLATARSYKCRLISADKKHHGKITDGTVIMLKDYSL